MDSRINALIESYRDEFVATLQEWVRVPSVKSEPAEGAPFGKDISRMMDLIHTVMPVISSSCREVLKMLLPRLLNYV